MALATGTILTIAAISGAVSTGVSVAGHLKQGRQARQTAQENAEIYNRQLGLVAQQKELTREQYSRERRRISGQIVSRTGASGFEMSGSPVDILNSNMEALEADEQIALQNLDRQGSMLESQAGRQEALGQSRYRGSLLKAAGTGAKGISTSLIPLMRKN